MSSFEVECFLGGKLVLTLFCFPKCSLELSFEEKQLPSPVYPRWVSFRTLILQEIDLLQGLWGPSMFLEMLGGEGVTDPFPLNCRKHICLDLLIYSSLGKDDISKRPVTPKALGATFNWTQTMVIRLKSSNFLL